MTRIILLRHGDVEGIDPPAFHGRIVLPLTAQGIRQAELTRDALRTRWTVDGIYCSPLTRCVRTTDIINEAFRLNTVPHQGLTDMDYGAWTSLTYDEVSSRWSREFDRWLKLPHETRVPGGESLQEVSARVVATVGPIFDTHPEGTVVIVLHDSVIRVLLCHLLNLPLSSYWLFDPALCGISHMVQNEHGVVVHSINETQHLSAP